MTFQVYLFLACHLVHLGKNMVNGLFASSYFLLIYKVSICMENLCKILVFSNIPFISYLVIKKEEEGITELLFSLLVFLVALE